MTRRAPLAATFLAATVMATGCRRPAGDTDLPRARAEHERLHVELARLVERDPVVKEALAQGGDVVLGIRPVLVEEILREVATRYLDRVVLDLSLEKQVHDSHDVRVKTFLGEINAGTWTLDVTIHDVHGVLRARAPRLSPGPDNTLALDVPVVLQEAHGNATLHFAWKSRSLASVVCHDFEVTRRLTGEVLSREYSVSGLFQLSAGREAVRADPHFPQREFRLQVDMTDRSWSEVRAAIDEQDTLLRCGLGLDPETLLARIRARLHEGFDVKLPSKIFRAVDFPAAVRQEVALEDRRVALEVKTHALAITPAAVWYGADLRTRLEPP